MNRLGGTPTGSADRQRQARRGELADHEDGHERQRVVPVDRALQHRVADAVHLREHEEQDAEQQATDGGPEPVRPAPHPVRDVLRPVDRPQEGHADEGGYESEQGEQRVDERRRDVSGRQRQEGVVAERRAPDGRGCDGGQDDGAESLGLEVAEDHLEREEDPGDRRVERRGDAGGRAAGDEQPQPSRAEPRVLPCGRPERRPDLDDRALAPDRASRADADGRGERLHERNLWADAAALARNRQHHLGHPVPACLRRPARDHRPVEQPAERRREHDERRPEPRDQMIGRVPGVAVVGPAAEELGEADDQPAEGDGAEPAQHADADRQRPQAGRARAEPAAQADGGDRRARCTYRRAHLLGSTHRGHIESEV